MVMRRLVPPPPPGWRLPRAGAGWVGRFRPVDEEISQRLGFDSRARFVENRVGSQLDGPHGDPASGVPAADDLSERSHAHHGDECS